MIKSISPNVSKSASSVIVSIIRYIGNNTKDGRFLASISLINLKNVSHVASLLDNLNILSSYDEETIMEIKAFISVQSYMVQTLNGIHYCKIYLVFITENVFGSLMSILDSCLTKETPAHKALGLEIISKCTAHLSFPNFDLCNISFNF